MDQVVVAALLSVTVVAGGILLWDIGCLPPVGNDEWFVLARFDRLVAFGDFRDLVAMDVFAENGRYSKLTPLSAPLRLSIHALADEGVALARPISAAQILVLGVALALTARRLGASRVALLAPAFLISCPTVFLFGRSFRQEQDTFFFGTLSLLVPALAGGGRAWLLAGLLAGTAACLHPMGIMFPLAFAVAVVLLRRCPGRAQMAGQVAVGIALPVVLTVIYYALDWENVRMYWLGSEAFHARHHPFRIRSLRALGPAPGWLPDQVAAAINAVAHGLRVPEAAPSSLGAATFRTWGGLLVCLAVAASVETVRLTRAAAEELLARERLVQLWPCGFLSAIAVTFAYPANTDYAFYAVGQGCVAAFLLGARVAGSRVPRVAVSGWLALLSGTVLGLAASGGALAAPSRNEGPSAASEVSAMRGMARRLGVDQGGAGVMYADTVSWAGAGQVLAPLYEYLVLEVAPLRPHRGVVFSLEWYDSFVGAIAPFTGQPIEGARRRRLMEEIVRPLDFAGAMVTLDSAGRPMTTRLWLLRRPPPAPIFVEVGHDGARSVWEGEALPTDELPASGRFAMTRHQALPRGRYAALLAGPGLSASRLAIRTGGAELVGPAVDDYPHRTGGPLLLFEAVDGVYVQAEGTTAPAGPVQIRYWRLRPATLNETTPPGGAGKR